MLVSYLGYLYHLLSQRMRPENFRPKRENQAMNRKFILVLHAYRNEDCSA